MILNTRSKHGRVSTSITMPRIPGASIISHHFQPDNINIRGSFRFRMFAAARYAIYVSGSGFTGGFHATTQPARGRQRRGTHHKIRAGKTKHNAPLLPWWSSRYRQTVPLIENVRSAIKRQRTVRCGLNLPAVLYYGKTTHSAHGHGGGWRVLVVFQSGAR